MTVEISVVIPARDAAATLAETLDALDLQTLGRDRFEVIVVDDGSTDGTGAVADRPGVRVLRHDAALGAGEARNTGVAGATAARIAFTDADCRPTAGWLEAGLLALADADLVQGAVGPEPGVEAGPYDRWVTITEDDGTYTTASLFVDAAAFAGVRGFEAPPLVDNGRLAVDKAGSRAPVGEDTWLGWRLRRAGARTSFAPAALVHHAVLPRGPIEFVREHTRRRHAPGFIRAIPELRDASFVWRRRFVNRRSAVVDVAVLGGALALLSHRATPAALAAPYALVVARDVAALGPAAAGARALADGVGLVALVAGNIRYRTLLL